MLSLPLARARRRVPTALASHAPTATLSSSNTFTASLPGFTADPTAVTAGGARSFVSLQPHRRRGTRSRSLFPSLSSSAASATTSAAARATPVPAAATAAPALVAVGAGLRPARVRVGGPLPYLPSRGHAGHHHHHHSPPSPAAAAADAAAQAQAQARSGLTHAQAQALDSRITRLGLYSNIGLTVVKAVAGVMGNSVALVADALHGLSDMVTDAVTLLTIKHASAPADRDHPYGHGRIEDVGTLAVSAIVVATGLGIGWHSVEKMVELAVASGGIMPPTGGEGAWASAVRTVEEALLGALGSGGGSGGSGHGHAHSLMEPAHHSIAPSADAAAAAATIATDAAAANAATAAAIEASADEAPTPSFAALAVALASVGIKEALFHATRRVSAQTGSRIVEINAWHHRSDAASSMIAVVGVAGAMLRWPVLDPLAGLAVAGMIAKQGWDMGVEVYHDITEKQLSEDILSQLRAEAKRCEPYGALAVYGLRGRKMGRDIAVDLTVVVPGHFGVAEARGVAELVSGRLLGLGLGVSEVMVAVDEEGSESARAGVAADAEAAAEAAAATETAACGEHTHAHGHDEHSHSATTAAAATAAAAPGANATATAAATATATADGEAASGTSSVPFPPSLRLLRSQAALEADIAAVVAAPAFAGKGLRLGGVTSRYEAGEVTATVEILLEPAAPAAAPAAASAAAAAPATAGASAGAGAALPTPRPCLPFVPSPFRPPAEGEAEGAALLRLRPVLTGLCGVHGVAAELQKALVEKVEGLDRAVVVLRLAG